ncbi:unnamed protein product [Closterium sp. Yama58-4]|nr:unnamed protein product [Closterium sp. Yama58-4]
MIMPAPSLWAAHSSSPPLFFIFPAHYYLPPGITSVSPKRIIAAIRCSIRLEAPLTAGGVPLVEEAFVRQLAAVANGKMALNRERTERFRTRFMEECSCSLLSHPPPQQSQPQPTPLHPAHTPVTTPRSHLRNAARRSAKGQREAANGHVTQRQDCQLAQQQGSQLSPRQLAQRQVAVLRRVGEVERRVVGLLGRRAVEQGGCEALQGGVAAVLQGGVATVTFESTQKVPGSLSAAAAVLSVVAGAGMVPLKDVAGGCCSSAWDLPTRPQESKDSAHELDGFSLPGSKAQRGQLHGQVVKVLGLPEGSLLRWGHSAVTVAASRAVVGAVGAGGAGATGGGSVVAKTSEAEETRGEAAGTAVVVFGGFGGSGVHGRRGDVVVVTVRGRAALADVFSLNLRTMTWRHVAAPEALSAEDKAATAATATAPVTTVAPEATTATAAADATAATAAADATAVTAATCVPVARYRHAAAALGSSIFVFGGTSHPHALPLTSLQVFSAQCFSWLPDPVVSGQIPAPRHSHAMATVGNRVYLFGGRDTQRVFSDLYFFEVVGSDSANGGWEAPQNPQEELSASSSNSSGTEGSRLHVRWTKVWDSAPVLIPERFSHSLTTYGQHLLIFGGCPHSRAGPEIILVNSAFHEVSRIPVALPPAALPVRHTASVVSGPLVTGGFAVGGATVGDRLLVLGGGAACFAFGSVFSPPFVISLKGILQGKIGHSNQQQQGQQQQQQEGEQQKQLEQDQEHGRQSQEGLGWVLLVPRREGKQWKDALQTRGVLDKTRKPATVNPDANPEVSLGSAGRSGVAGDGGELLLALPVSESAVSTVAAMDGGCMAPPTVPVSAAGMTATALNPAASQSAAAVLTKLSLSPSPARPLTPFQRLHHAIQDLLHLKSKQLHSSEDNQTTATHSFLLSQLPARWERLGDMVVLPADAMLGEAWDRLGLELWKVVAEALGAARVARQAPVAPTLTRDSQLHLLLGYSSWVERRENGITYTFDAAKCMFSSGNGTEKQRMAALRLHDWEVVVDLFAGIGYFTIPLLVHARARHVFACEWNPAAVHGLRFSLAANQVLPDRYTVLEGDNRVVAPVGVADRVLLGLIPSSKDSWRTAIRCLKPREGGVAHVHGNVVDVEEQQWTDHVVGELREEKRGEAGKLRQCIWNG